MTVIAGKTIKRLVEEGKLRIEPFHEDAMEPASYDLRLGYKVLVSPVLGEKGKIVDLRKEKDHSYLIQNGQFVSVLTEEKLALPNDFCGRFGLRSAYTRKGLLSFGGLQIDPGWRGHLVISLFNIGPEPVEIRLGEKIFTVEFHNLDEATDKPYGSEPQQIYQDQDDFPQSDIRYILNAKTISLAELASIKSRVDLLENEVLKGKPFALRLEEFRSVSFEEHGDLAEMAYQFCKAEIEKTFAENPQVLELVICDGKVIHTSNERGGITKEIIEKIMEEKKKPCYIFARPFEIEESPWIQAKYDYYPTMELYFGHELWSEKQVLSDGRKVVADFDTGNRAQLVFPEELTEGIIPPPTPSELQYLPYVLGLAQVFPRNIRICVKDLMGKTKSDTFLGYFATARGWRLYKVFNPRREAFVGRNLMYRLNFKITLNPETKSSIVEHLS